MTGKDNQLIEKANKHINKMNHTVNSDYHRLSFHVMPRAGLLNDPNGFVQYNGEYHLFYQLHPFDTHHGLKFWGHVKSDNLVDWKQMQIALAPDKQYDSHGCYSGSGIVHNDEMTLMYTGNVKDKDGNRETYQCLVASRDGETFIKSKENPVIINQPKGYTRHFRDPKVWKQNGVYYMIIGAQTERLEGCAILYQSTNMTDWNLIGEVAGANQNPLSHLGYMWECPDLFSLNNKDALIFCPQGVKSDGILYNNIYQAGYMIGNLNYESGQFSYGEFIELDRGFEFYAPQTTLDDKGRRILIAWMGLPEEEEHPTTKYGWIHALTIPRLLSLKGNRIIQQPIPELALLRKNQVEYHKMKVESELQLDEIQGDVFELIVELSSVATEFGIKLRKSENEETVLSYNKGTNMFTFDRTGSGEGYKGRRSCKLESNSLKKIQIFSDTSSLEIFLNDGEEVFTGRIYPGQDSQGIEFYSKGGHTTITSLYKWDLKS